MSHQKNFSQLQALLVERGVSKDNNHNGFQEFIERKEATAQIGLFGRTVLVEGSMHLATGRTQSVKKFKI